MSDHTARALADQPRARLRGYEAREATGVYSIGWRP